MSAVLQCRCPLCPVVRCCSVTDAEPRGAAGDDQPPGPAGHHADPAGHPDTADGVSQPRPGVSLPPSLPMGPSQSDWALKQTKYT